MLHDDNHLHASNPNHNHHHNHTKQHPNQYHNHNHYSLTTPLQVDSATSLLLGHHLVATSCPSDHSRQALCCKMQAELDMFLKSDKRWDFPFLLLLLIMILLVVIFLILFRVLFWLPLFLLVVLLLILLLLLHLLLPIIYTYPLISNTFVRATWKVTPVKKSSEKETENKIETRRRTK